MEINNHKPYSRCRVWWCDVTTSNSIQDDDALVVNILVFDHRVQLQHCTYRRKTLLFALIKVSTFICKREISGLSSPLNFILVPLYVTLHGKTYLNAFANSMKNCSSTVRNRSNAFRSRSNGLINKPFERLAEAVWTANWNRLNG